MALKKEKRVQLPTHSVRANIVPESLNAEQRTVELSWGVGVKGLRSGWDGAYYEQLDMNPASIRMGRLTSGNAPLLDAHDQYSGCDAVMGVVVAARIENGQGFATVRFADTPDVENTWRKVQTGIIKNVSVGYSVYRYDRQPMVEGEEVPTYLATDWEPYELSMVPVGFDETATTRSRSNQKDVECVVINNLSEERNTEMDEKEKALKLEQERAAAEKASAEKAQAERALAERLAGEKAREAEKVRTTEIRSMYKKVGLSDESAEKAIKEDVTVEAARGLVIEELANRQNDPAKNAIVTGGAPANQVSRVSGLENALLHRANPGKVALTEEGRNFRGMGLLEMARDMLAAGGVSARGLSKMELATRAFHSTSDFSNVLANVANKSLRQGYDEAPRTFLGWAKQAQLPDFKQVSRTQLGEAPVLEKIGEDGEIKRGTIKDGAEKYSLASYAKIVGITRQVIINDDLGAFTNMPSKFGFAAASLESDVVYAILTANAAMADGNALFSSAHKNLGTAGVPSVSTLSELRALMRKQVGLDGSRILNIQGQYLVGPAALETVFEQLLSQLIVATQTSNANPFVNKLMPVIEPRLDAASATAYYMMASPGAIDTVEYGYLEGQQGVYSETRMGFDVDGVEVKARLDFAAKALDHRGLAKNAG